MKKILVLAAIAFLLADLIAALPPTPHSIDGTVYDSLGINQAASGTQFTVNDSISGDLIRDFTGAGPYTGRYAVIINGNDGDFVQAMAWNSTHYGQRNTSLAGDISGLDFNMYANRTSEANVTIIYPSNFSQFNISVVFNLTINFSMLGANGSYCNATLSISDTAVVSLNGTESANHPLGNITLRTYNSSRWALKAITEGKTNITARVRCASDRVILENLNTANLHNLTVPDTIPPYITLLAPANNTVNLTNNTFSLWFNVSDGSPVQNCSLKLNSALNKSIFNVTKEIWQNFTLTLQNGAYNWMVQCWDAEGNLGNSTTFNITPFTPDLTTDSSLLRFNPPGPVENQTLNISVTVINLGSTSIASLVMCRQNSLGGPRIGNFTVPALNYMQNITANISYTVRIGQNLVFCIADANYSIAESNEQDNWGNISYLLSSWFIVYGNVSGRKLLDNSVNLSLSRWSSPINTIFITSGTVNWMSLQAFAMTSDNQSSMDDFATLDRILNTTHLTDSVNRSFTNSSELKSNASLRIFTRMIDNVPIINTTPAGNFFTGILWDYSGGYTQYNGSPQVVFVTQVNRAKQGYYGTYDYEIAVPAMLRNYNNPSGSPLDLYYELT